MRVRSALRRVAGSVRRWHGVLVLNYHRIGDGRRSIFDRGLWSATAEDFENQLRWLKTNFDIISPRDLSYVVRVKRGRHVVVTFDDGYPDNYLTAFPILKALGLQATFFVATGYIGQPRISWWDEIAWMVRTSRRSGIELPNLLLEPVVFDEPDRDRAVRAILLIYGMLPVQRTAAFLDGVGRATGTGRYLFAKDEQLWMTWDMLREMQAAGMTIGGHTMSHQILSRMSRDQQRQEIEGCAQTLEKELGRPMRTFSYPVGKRDSFNSDSRDCLRDAGVQTAFSYYGGLPDLRDWDPFDIPRVPVEQHTTFDDFRGLVMAPRLNLGGA